MWTTYLADPVCFVLLGILNLYLHDRIGISQCVVLINERNVIHIHYAIVLTAICIVSITFMYMTADVSLRIDTQ